jgi:hypothetical protein
MHLTNEERSHKSLIGSILIALGVFIFCANLDRTCAELVRTLFAFPRQALGAIPTLVLSAASLVQACSSNHHCLLHILMLHIVMVVWPLLLVAVGAILHEARDSQIRLQNKQFCNVSIRTSLVRRQSRS